MENLRNAVVSFSGLRDKLVNVKGNKKRNTQNIQVKKQQKKTQPFELFLVDKPKRSHRVDYSAMVKGH